MNDEYKIMAVERGDWIEMDRQLMYWNEGSSVNCKCMPNIMTKEVVLEDGRRKCRIEFKPKIDEWKSQ
jgi:hypothetical protein